jgi:hypothetical protein
MASDPEPRVRELWRQDDERKQAMTLSDIRAKAERLDAQSRRGALVGAVVFALAIAVNIWEIAVAPGVVEATADALIIAAFIYMAWRYRSRHASARPAALGQSTGVEHYRAELVRQRNLAGDSWAYLLPFAPGLALNILGGAMQGRSSTQVWVAVGLGIALFVGIAWLNAWTAQKHQRHLDALDAL